MAQLEEKPRETMAYLFYRHRINTKVELILKDGAAFPKGERRTEWYVHRQCEHVALPLASEIEHFGFVLREPPEIHV